MKDIELLCPFGDDRKKVYISHNQAGSGGYQLLIDSYYQGDLVKKNGAWLLLSNTNNLTADDIQILGELIDDNF